MTEDPAKYAARQAERRRQYEAEQEQGFRDRLMAQAAKELGMPSARMREASAAPLQLLRGSDKFEWYAVKMFHRVPGGQGSHKLDEACWCKPTPEADSDSTARYFKHYAVQSWERGASTPASDTTKAGWAEAIEQQRRERAER